VVATHSDWRDTFFCAQARDKSCLEIQDGGRGTEDWALCAFADVTAPVAATAVVFRKSLRSMQTAIHGYFLYKDAR
jgi:hypothetical protein